MQQNQFQATIGGRFTRNDHNWRSKPNSHHVLVIKSQQSDSLLKRKASRLEHLHDTLDAGAAHRALVGRVLNVPSAVHAHGHVTTRDADRITRGIQANEAVGTASFEFGGVLVLVVREV